MTGRRAAETMGRFIKMKRLTTSSKVSKRTATRRMAISKRSGKRAATMRLSKKRPVQLGVTSILVPLDFSTESRKALAYAVPFARQFGAHITVLHVVEPVATPDFAKSFPLALENEKVMRAAREQLDNILKIEGVEADIIGKVLVRYGRSFQEITGAARNINADLIIISTHGYTGFKHALLGSTTERVVRHASCPVLVVRSR